MCYLYEHRSRCLLQKPASSLQWQLSGPLLQTTTSCTESAMMNLIAYTISKRRNNSDYAVIELPVPGRPNVFEVKIAYQWNNTVRLVRPPHNYFGVLGADSLSLSLCSGQQFREVIERKMLECWKWWLHSRVLCHHYLNFQRGRNS